jgi:nitrite reductase/ring-hydroxylating ferredoxin subunit
MKAIARLDDIPASGLKFTYRDGPFEEEGLLLKVGADEVRAFKNECRHLPMPLDDRDPGELWDPEGRYLVCNAHGARYRPNDGLCVAGPCEGSHLKVLPVHVRDGEVYLDVSALGSFFDV